MNDSTTDLAAKPKIAQRRGRGLGSRPGRFTAWLLKPTRQRGLGIVLFILGLFTLWSVAMTKLSQDQQVVFAILCFAVFLVANRFPGRGISLFLIALSVTVSFRYIVWRATNTLNYDSLPAALLGTGLVLAETYAVMVLALGYFQTAWPLERKPVPLHGSPLDWPTVDVYVPTYNEDLDIVRQTVLAAMSMDYPASKLNVYILDDGKRASFRAFAEEAGCGYIARADNSHAKAGNLNHALGVTEGEFIAIFDARLPANVARLAAARPQHGDDADAASFLHPRPVREKPRHRRDGAERRQHVLRPGAAGQ
jgi:cellulose synthase (UDP-forming)